MSPQVAERAGAAPLSAAAALPAAGTDAARDSDPLAATVHFTAASIGAAVGAAPQRSYVWRNLEGEENLLDRRDVIRLIRDGSLSPEDALSEGGGPFKLASEYDDLKRYFQMRLAPPATAVTARSTGPLLGCARHPQTHAAWCCGMCGSYWCDPCAPPKRISSTTVTPCPHCSEPCLPIQSQVEVVPFWLEIGSLFLYPLKGWGAAMWVMYSIMLWFAKAVLSMGPFMWFAGFSLYFFTVTYTTMIVKSSAEGGRKMPDWPDISSWWDVIGRGFRGLAAQIISFLPLIAFVYFVARTYGTGLTQPSEIVKAAGILLLGAIPLLVFTFVYYPMAFLIVSVFDTIVPALNPFLIFKAIARIPKDYAIALVFIAVLAIAGGTLSYPFRLIPIIGGLPAAIINSYFTFVWLHVLGRMGHQCEEKLNWVV